MTQTVVVVGGGIAGLAVSFEILQRQADLSGPLELHCLERSAHGGGNIHSVRAGDYLCEAGPNGFLDNAPATLDLVHRLGLDDRLLPANKDAAIRYIWRKGKLRKLPTGALSFLTSGVLGMRGKLRLLCEPFARKQRGGVDETVFDFAARRIGKEAARVLVGAMVSGVYAGDARRLSLRSTFPKMHAMEEEHGSLFRAMLAKARAKRLAKKKGLVVENGGGGPAGTAGHLTSFRDGLQELPEALAKVLGKAFKTEHCVTGINRNKDGGFLLHVRDKKAIVADAVVLASPSWHAAELVGDLDPELCAALAAIPSAGLCVLQLGYDEQDLPVRPLGFGFLVPQGEGQRILGALWSSNIFTGRAPAGHFLLAAMIGGARDQAALSLDDEALTAAVRSDLRQTMGIVAAPSFCRIFRHSRGIPQYDIGHERILSRIDARLAQHAGLFVHGNAYRGISVNLCVEQAPKLACQVIASLRGPD